MDTSKLTPKQKAFCEEYLIDLNATQAAIRAGYSSKTANTVAAQNLAKLSIQEYVSFLKGKREERTEITADMVIQEYAKVAFINVDDYYNEDGSVKRPDELSDKARGALAFYDVRKIKDGDDFIDVPIHRTHDKMKALEALGKHLGIFEKDNEQSKSVVAPQFNLSVKPKN